VGDESQHIAHGCPIMCEWPLDALMPATCMHFVMSHCLHMCCKLQSLVLHAGPSGEDAAAVWNLDGRAAAAGLTNASQAYPRSLFAICRI
jgi:hypothetical protein